MKRKYWKTSRHSGGASRKSPKTTATGQSSPLSGAAIDMIDRYSEEIKNMPDDKNAPIEFLRNCPLEQIENIRAAQMTTKSRIMTDFIYENFRGIHRFDVLISPEDPLFSHRDDPLSADDFVIAEYLNGVNLYFQSTQVTLRVINPFQEEKPDFFFTEDQILAWIDEIESSIEVTESAAS